ncbi:MAG TPA: amidase family protein [Acetobacteraceae bacterium]
MNVLGLARLAALLPLLTMPMLPAMAQTPAPDQPTEAPVPRAHKPLRRPAPRKPAQAHKPGTAFHRVGTRPAHPLGHAPFVRLPPPVPEAEGLPGLSPQPPDPVGAMPLPPPVGITAEAPIAAAPVFLAAAIPLPTILGEIQIPSPPPVVLPTTATATPSPVPAPPVSTQTTATKAPADMCIENADITALHEALAAGETTAADLVRAYFARIAAYDRAGPLLNSVREVNPDALAIAAKLDAERPAARRRPLEGIPILLKDNIATGDNEHTTAGSLALADAQARRDATIAARLRHAGAIILGKANLTEFANVIALGMPPGYSSLGGQVRNPYALAVDDKGVPIVPTGGSSAGSAVAVAAGLAAASIGTETSGSLLSPASQNGLVTIKPTLGLVSAAGIIPIAHSQDVAGPMTRTVRDAAIILSVIAGPDPLDPATAHAPAGTDYTKFLDKAGLRGKRIGVPSVPSDPGNDVYYGPLSPRAAAVMADAIKVLEAQGATIVRESMPTEGWIGGPGTTMNILNRNPESPDFNKPMTRPIVFVYELKHDMNLYLKDWAKGTHIKTLGDIIAFNAAHADRALRFGQDTFLAAEGTSGDLTEPEYISARQMDLRAARDSGLDAYMEENMLDAVLFPGTAGASIAAAAGYPSVQVPAGFTSGIAGKDTPDYPIGATFTGRAFSEPALISIAYAFEQATLARRMPPGVPALGEGCGD